MNLKYLKKWICAAGVRAIKTIAQTAISAIGVQDVMLHEVNWIVVASTAVVAGIISVLTSIAGLPEVKLEEGEE